MPYAPEPARGGWYNPSIELPPIDPTAHVCEAAGDIEYEEVVVPMPAGLTEQSGRASCRERVCIYV